MDEAFLSSPTVAAVRTAAGYPRNPPYHPSERYPEMASRTDLASESNAAYDGVRRLFVQLGWDSAAFGTSEWNPLGHLVRPGDRVLVKPNFIREAHLEKADVWECVITHGSVIRAVVDYVLIALDGRGEIVVADGPQTDSSYQAIAARIGITELSTHYASRADVPVIFRDLRREAWMVRDGVVVRRDNLPGDPAGYVAVDLGSASHFHDHGGAGRYYGADYDAQEVNAHHTGGRHEYLLCGSAVHADVVINVPKLKTHKKTGITCSLKNLVGINGDRNWLPHHTEGTPATGGDQFDDEKATHHLENFFIHRLRRLSLAAPVIGPWVFRQSRRLGTRFFGHTEQVVRSGNWHGNDTTWRMVLDLNIALLYGGGDGTLPVNPDPSAAKRYLSIVDGIVAGEGNGPLAPDPVAAGVLLAGLNPAAVDACAGSIMGFDLNCLPVVLRAFDQTKFPLAPFRLADVTIVSDEPSWAGLLLTRDPRGFFSFRPHFGWVGRIERRRATA